jgi:hypothetical protein
MTDTWDMLMYFGDTEIGLQVYCGAATAVIGVILIIFYRKNEDQKFFSYLIFGLGAFTVFYPLFIFLELSLLAP